MPRRAHSGTNATQTILILAGIVFLALAGWFLFSRSTDPFANVTDLEVSDYFESANSLSGNVYKVRGTIDELLEWMPDKGRLFSVLVGDGRERDPLPVLVPAEFADQNVQQGQEFLFKVRVGEGGILLAEDLLKI